MTDMAKPQSAQTRAMKRTKGVRVKLQAIMSLRREKKKERRGNERWVRKSADSSLN